LMMISAIAVNCLAFLGVPGGAQTNPSYHLIKKVNLGGTGTWDYLSIDVPARQIFITNTARVRVVDADRGTVVGEITDPQMQGTHGVAIVDPIKRGFISNGVTNTVTVFDLETFKPTATVKVGKHPDAIIYDPASRRVFTFNADTQDATVIDPATNEVVGTVPVDGKPEFAGVDGSGKIFVNVEDKNLVLAIDSRSLKVTDRWPTAPCEEPSGMAIDAATHRLFSGCHNQMIAVMDMNTGKVVATPPIGLRVDANRFDPSTHLVFSSNGGGTLTVIHEDSPDKYTVVQNVQTEVGARTMEVDPQTHRVYLMTGDLRPTPPTPDNPHPHPTVLPNTMRLLIYAMR
jgi:YVTN family beta-propeller protein